MVNNGRRRVFIPVMLMTLLAFGAVAAEAGDNRGDRVKKGAVIGAAVGTLLQLAQGRNEGRDLLHGAAVGSVLGAAAGAADDARRDRYHRRGYGYGDDGYHRDHRPAGRYDRDRYDHDRYDRDGRYDRRTAHRHGSRCRHH